MPVYETLQDLHIMLPELTAPVAVLVPFLRSRNLLFSSDHIAKISGKPWIGKLGADLTIAQGQEAARAVAIDLTGTLHAAVGDLDKIKSIAPPWFMRRSRFADQTILINTAARTEQRPRQFKRATGTRPESPKGKNHESSATLV